MTIYVLFAVPISAYIITKLGQSIRRKSMRSSIQIAGLMNIFQETITGIRIVKAFIMENLEIKRFAKENYKLIAYGMDTRIFDSAIKREFEIFVSKIR